MKKFVFIFFAFILTISLIGCSLTPKPEDTVKSFLESAKTLESDKMIPYINSINALEVNRISINANSESKFNTYLSSYLKDYASKITYTIGESKISDNKASVKVTFKYTDGTLLFSPVFNGYEKQVFDKDVFKGNLPNDEQASALIKNLADENISKVSELNIEKTIDINCIKIDNQWKIDSVLDNLKNILTSNYYSVFNNLVPIKDDTNSIKNKIYTISMYLVDDLYTNGVYDFNYYVMTGRDSKKRAFNVDSAMLKFIDIMDKKSKYDTYISGINDPTYTEIKNLWCKVSAKANSIYVRSDYENIDNLEQYISDYMKAVQNIKK